MTDDQRKLRNERLRERLRSLLADRFGLVVQHEEKQQTVYSLITAKNGPKLIAVTTPGDRQGTISVNEGHLQGFAAPIGMLATQLSDATRRIVVDETNLTGKFDFLLEWTPDGPLERLDSPGAGQAAGATGPSIFTALQDQLGLRLKSSTGLVDVVVIDQVNRPSAN